MNYYIIHPDGRTEAVEMEKYILQRSGETPKTVEEGGFIVRHDRVPVPGGEVLVSTVFLGIDHGWNMKGSPHYQPVLFETMILNWPRADLDFYEAFGGEYQERYCTFKEAKEGHKLALNILHEFLKTGKRRD